MLESFDRITQAAMADEVAFTFCSLILMWSACSVTLTGVNVYRPITSARQFLSITPSALASLGVLGTFTGILLGLLDFDVSNVDASVPALLAGLKVAFITSIVGIAGSVGFRAIQALVPSGTTQSGASGQDIYDILSEIRDDARANSKDTNELLQEVRQAISSDGDSSLLTQVQKLRTTIQDGQSELIKEFREFAEHMVENNQTAIIEALENVIRDFNAKITEQFGDNFKQLNEAVSRMVEWQDNYRDHVESVEEAIQLSVQSVESCEQALAAVREHTAVIPTSMQQMPTLMEKLQAQVETLSALLEAIAQLRAQAINAFPIIEENLKKLTNELAINVGEAIRKTEDAMELQDAGMRSLTEGASAAQVRFNSALETTLDNMNQQSGRAFEQYKMMIDDTSNAVRSQTEAAWKRTAERMEERIDELDRQIGEELSRAMGLIADHLTGISNRFANDYRPLADRLREVVRLAEGL